MSYKTTLEIYLPKNAVVATVAIATPSFNIVLAM